MKLTIELDCPANELLAQAEAKVMEHVFAQSRYNQLRTAIRLGVSRSTLRTKLKSYFGDKYIGTRHISISEL